MSAEPWFSNFSAGNYMVRVVCVKCLQAFDVPALAQQQRRICPACEQVDKWMQEAEHDAS